MMWIVSCFWTGGSGSVEVLADSSSEAQKVACLLLIRNGAESPVIAEAAVSLDEIWPSIPGRTKGPPPLRSV